jgi:hypothetical protein
VFALYSESHCISPPDKIYEHVMDVLLGEFERTGLLCPDVTGRYPAELYDTLKAIVLSMKAGENKSRTAFLRDIGRNHPRYFAAALFFLDKLCREGLLEKRKQSYYRLG